MNKHSITYKIYINDAFSLNQTFLFLVLLEKQCSEIGIYNCYSMKRKTLLGTWQIFFSIDEFSKHTDHIAMTVAE